MTLSVQKPSDHRHTLENANQVATETSRAGKYQGDAVLFIVEPSVLILKFA